MDSRKLEVIPRNISMPPVHGESKFWDDAALMKFLDSL